MRKLCRSDSPAGADREASLQPSVGPQRNEFADGGDSVARTQRDLVTPIARAGDLLHSGKMGDEGLVCSSTHRPDRGLSFRAMPPFPGSWTLVPCGNRWSQPEPGASDLKLRSVMPIVTGANGAGRTFGGIAAYFNIGMRYTAA